MKLEVELTEESLARLSELVAGKLNTPEKRRTPYTMGEAAEVLGVSRATISLRVKAGSIATVPGIGVIRIPAVEIERLLNGRAQG